MILEQKKAQQHTSTELFLKEINNSYFTIKVYSGVLFKGQKYTYSPFFKSTFLEDDLLLFFTKEVTYAFLI